MGRKQDAFDYVVKYKGEHNGNSPSFREIGSALEINSTSYVRHLLKQLEGDGELQVGTGARNITVPGYRWVRNGSG